jgi:hypothetical protein
MIITPEEREEFKKEFEEIAVLIDEGHTHYCACRIIWGDGECECLQKYRKENNNAPVS